MENLPWLCSPSNNERFLHPHFSTKERGVLKNTLATVISEDSEPDHIRPASSDWYVFRTCPHHVNSPVKNETNKYHLRDWSSWHLWRDHGGECGIPVLSTGESVRDGRGLESILAKCQFFPSCLAEGWPTTLCVTSVTSYPSLQQKGYFVSIAR